MGHVVERDDGPESGLRFPPHLRVSWGEEKRTKGGFCVSQRYLITATTFCIAGHDLSVHLGLGFIQSKPVSRLPPPSSACW